jgi:hypothetical protein
MDNEKEEIYYGKLCSIFYDITKKYASTVEVDFFSSFFKKSGRILEAMSGSGRLQIPLMKKGYVVDGVDSSLDMLDRCIERSGKFFLKPDLYQQSLDNFGISVKYQTVLIAIGSFQLIVDRQIALNSLKNIRAHMLDSADLLINIFVPNKENVSWVKRVARIDSNAVINLTTRRVIDEDQKIANGYCSYELIVNGKIKQKEQELIQVTWYSDDEFASLLNEAGFEILKIYDDPIPNTDESKIVHARLK